MFESSIDNLNRERRVFFTKTTEDVYLGEVAVDGEKVRLSIDLGQGFPSTFPIISVVDSVS